MRSRYCAYRLGERDYLLQSWHADFRPAQLHLDPAIIWLGLEIIRVEQFEFEARVEFEARLLVDGRVEALHENSDFLRHQGCWFYTAGKMLPARFDAWKPGRNEACPCGSGAKFKRCCGA